MILSVQKSQNVLNARIVDGSSLLGPVSVDPSITIMAFANPSAVIESALGLVRHPVGSLRVCQLMLTARDVSAPKRRS